MKPTRATILAAAVLLMAGCAGMTYAPVKYSSGVMTGPNGMTLYTFDKDVPGSGKSVCNGQCATNWPPFAAPANEGAGGDWSIVTRDDGLAFDQPPKARSRSGTTASVRTSPVTTRAALAG